MAGVVTIFSGLFPLISSAFKYILIIGKTLATLYLIYENFLFPYVKKYTNVYVLSSLVSFIIVDILHFCSFFLNISNSIIIISFFVPIIFFFLIFSFIMHFYLKNYQQLLQPDDFEDLRENFDNYFESLNILTPKKALFYIRIGFISPYSLVIEGTFLLWIADKFKLFDIIYHSVSICDFFSLMNLLSKHNF